MTVIRRLAVAYALATAVVSVGSCGSTGGISKADFIARADGLCTTLRHQLDSIAPPTTVAEEAVYLDRSIQVNEAAQKKLRALTPPPGDEAAVGKVLDDFDEILARARVAEKEALTGDATATDTAVKEIGLARDRAEADAKQYGFRMCAAPPPSPSP